MSVALLRNLGVLDFASRFDLLLCSRANRFTIKCVRNEEIGVLGVVDGGLKQPSPSAVYNGLDFMVLEAVAVSCPTTVLSI